MRFWIGVASRERVMIGVDGGFCQLGSLSFTAGRRN